MNGCEDEPVPPPAAPGGDQAAAGKLRVDGQLRVLFESDPQARALVAVRFTALPHDDDLGRLGLAASGANPDVGTIDAAQFRELLARPDVVSIVAEPQPDLFT